MFEFQKLDVYLKTRKYCKDIKLFIAKSKLDFILKDQLSRASTSILLNLAEGSARFSKKDRRHFMVMARGSVFECVGIMDHLVDIEKISKEGYDYFYNTLEEISKMLYAIIKKLGDD